MQATAPYPSLPSSHFPSHPHAAPYPPHHPALARSPAQHVPHPALARYQPYAPSQSSLGPRRGHNTNSQRSTSLASSIVPSFTYASSDVIDSRPTTTDRPPPIDYSRPLRSSSLAPQQTINVTTEISAVVEPSVSAIPAQPPTIASSRDAPEPASCPDSVPFTGSEPPKSAPPPIPDSVAQTTIRRVDDGMPTTKIAADRERNLEPRSGGFAIQRAPLTGRGPFSQLQEFKLSDSSHYFEYTRSRHLNHDVHRLMQEEPPLSLARSSSLSMLRNKGDLRRWSSGKFLHRAPPSNVIVVKTASGRKYGRIITDDLESAKATSGTSWVKLRISDDDRAKIADESTYNVNRISRSKGTVKRQSSARKLTGKRSRFSEDVSHADDSEEEIAADIPLDLGEPPIPDAKDEEDKTPAPVLDPLPKSHSLHFDPEKFVIRNVLAEAEDQSRGKTSLQRLTQGMRKRSRSPVKRKAVAEDDGSSRFQQHIKYLKEMTSGEPTIVEEVPCHSKTPSGGSAGSETFPATLSDAKSGKFYVGSARRISGSLPQPGPAPNTALPAVPEGASTPARNSGSPDKYNAFPRISPSRRMTRSPTLGDFPNPPESPSKVSPAKNRRYAMISPSPSLPLSDPPPESDRAERVASRKARDLARQIAQTASAVPLPTSPAIPEPLAIRQTPYTPDSHSSLEVVTAYSEGHGSGSETLASTISREDRTSKQSKDGKQDFYAEGRPNSHDQTHGRQDVNTDIYGHHDEYQDNNYPSKETHGYPLTDNHTFSPNENQNDGPSHPQSNHQRDTHEYLQDTRNYRSNEDQGYAHSNHNPDNTLNSPLNGDEGYIQQRVPDENHSRNYGNQDCNSSESNHSGAKADPWKRSFSTSMIPTPAIQRCLDRVPTPYKHDLFRRASKGSSHRSSMTEASVEARLSRLEMSNKMLVKAFMAVVEATAEISVGEQEDLEAMRDRELMIQDQRHSRNYAGSSVDFRTSHSSSSGPRFSQDNKSLIAPVSRDSRLGRTGLETVLAQLDRPLAK